jgi:hypothetical protein
MTMASVYSDDTVSSDLDVKKSHSFDEVNLHKSTKKTASFDDAVKPSLKQRAPLRKKRGLWHVLFRPKPLLYALSLGWVIGVVTYTSVLTNGNEIGSLPFSFYAISFMVASIPSVAFIVCGMMLSQIERINRSNKEVLTLMRQMNSPITMASDDVKTVSSTVSHELTKLRDALREIEEGLSSVQGTFGDRINQLHETSQAMDSTLKNASHNLVIEREELTKLMKTVNKEFSDLSEQTSHVFKTIKSHRTGLEMTSDILARETPEDEDILQAASWAHQKNNVLQSISQFFNDSTDGHENGAVSEGDFISETPHTIKSDIEMPSFIYGNHSTTPSHSLPVIPLPDKESVSHERSQEEGVRLSDSAVIRKERHLYDGLHALSIDFNRLLESNPPSDLWRQYMRGERDVFTTYLFGWLEGQSRRLRVEYDSSEEFRRLTTRYLSQYDSLIERLDHYENALLLKEEMAHSVAGKLCDMLMSVSARYADA